MRILHLEDARLPLRHLHMSACSRDHPRPQPSLSRLKIHHWRFRGDAAYPLVPILNDPLLGRHLIMRRRINPKRAGEAVEEAAERNAQGQFHNLRLRKMLPQRAE